MLAASEMQPEDPAFDIMLREDRAMLLTRHAVNNTARLHSVVAFKGIAARLYVRWKATSTKKR
jgi:hypothetical protein